MAVNKITNKHVVSKESINRGEQISTRNIVSRGGNDAASIAPGSDASSNFSINLKNIDSAILNHIKQVVRPKVREANEMVDVPIMYGNEERWVAVRERGALRDKNGSLVLPLIMLKRVSIDKNEMSDHDFQHDVQNEHVQIVRSSKWSKDNRYDRFSVQTGKKPQTERLLTSMPNFRDISYEFILWTAFTEQMNPLVELFVEETNKYWGDGTDYKFLCNVDTISDASELTIDSERIIKSTFSLTAKAYLLPEYLNSVITNKVSNMKRELTPSKIVFGFEGNATADQIKNI